MKIHICALILGALVAQAALADDSDPPALVGRVSFVQGNAGLQTGDAAAEQVELNRPVTIGDRIRTEDQALLEISLGTAAVRLDQNTDVTIANLDDDIVQLQLDGGALSLHVFELERNENIEVDTPTATVRIAEAGDYRIDADDDGATRLAVRHGNAEIEGSSGSIRVRDQQQLVFDGSDQPAEVFALTTPDDFDEWSMSRDRRFEDQKATQYVSREVVGYEDLDAYGTWDNTPEYGTVWYPTSVPDDWAPYRMGRWVWVSPWGWSWVDNAPWGFAPFHYGRWAFVGRRWCWVPGPRNVRPVYAPALVAFTGGSGGGLSIGFSITNRPSRWLPLGPREVYVPAHPVSTRYLHNVNVSNTRIVNTTIITNAYRNRSRDFRFANRNVPNAVTTRESLPRFARPAPVVRPLPPRPSFSRGIAQREGVPVATQPPRPARSFRNDRPGNDRPGENGRPAFNVRSGENGRPAFNVRPGENGRPAFNVRPGDSGRPTPGGRPGFIRPNGDRAGEERRDLPQRPALQSQPQFQQRAQIERQAELQRQQQQQQFRQDQQLRQEQQSRQQRQIAEESARQRQLSAAAEQRAQEARQQQAQFQAQQAARQNELRQQQAQREQQVRQQRAQFQAQQAQRQSREQAPRAVERRGAPPQREPRERQQLR